MDTPSLSNVFLDRLGIPTSPGQKAKLERTLVSLHEAVRRAWPRVQLEPSVFLEHLAERLPRAKPFQALEAIHAPDLYLACACARGDTLALAELDRHFLSQVGSYVAKIDPSRAFVEELRQTLRRSLFVAEPGAAAKIGQYSGSGPLAGWLRVVAIRTARNLRRKIQPLVTLNGEGGELLASRAPDPELQYLKKRYGQAFRESFQAALVGLPAKQRTILALHLLEGMSSAAIGRSYQVHGATVRLWIKHSRAALLNETTRLLNERWGIPPDELTSLIGMLQSQLDVTISRFLRAPTGGPASSRSRPSIDQE